MASIFVAAQWCQAQTSTQVLPSPSASPSPSVAHLNEQAQESERVDTEEVRIPVVVTDARGRFDPTVELGDLLVLEDGVPQEIKSIRHVPSSVLLLINTSGELNPSMSASKTRGHAAQLISKLRQGDRMAVLQYGAKVEAIQGWTRDREAMFHALETKLSSTRGAHLAEALRAAEERFAEVPAGNRHLVLVTDGVDDSAEGEAALVDAVRRLLAAHVTVHVIGYAEIGREAISKSAPPVRVTGQKPRKTAADIAQEIMNPLGTPAWKPQIYVTIDTDFEMRRRRDRYVKAMRASEQWLNSLAVETGGNIFLPRTAEEIVTRFEEVGHSIGAQYVVAYRPKRPLSSAGREEYRRLEVAPRRIGLEVKTRRGYVVPAPPTAH